ncbi:MAG: nucleotidyltransferase family protein [bacterium]|nr:nucleotidyltransferase family protein [bacterium]
MTRVNIQRKLERNKELIKARYHVEKIGLFGSFVVGDQMPSSDIDILVEFKKGHKDFFNYMRLKNHLRDLLGREIDLVMESAVKPQLKKNIFNQVQYV